MAILRPSDIVPKKLDISEEFPFLNKALGGWPLGKIVLIWGDPSSGKTTFASKIIALAQKFLEGYVLWGDAEWSFDPSWHIDKIGVNPDTLYVVRDESAEQIFQDMRAVYAEIKERGARLIGFLFDSYVSMVTKDELSKDVDESKRMAELARLLTTETKIWMNWIATEDAVGIIINQMRANISGYGGGHRNPGAEIKDFVKHLEFRFKADPKDEKWKKYGITPVTMTVTKSKINTIRVGMQHMYLLRNSDGKIMDFWSDIAPDIEFGVKVEGSKLTDLVHEKTYNFADILGNYRDFAHFWHEVIEPDIDNWDRSNIEEIVNKKKKKSSKGKSKKK